MIEYYIANDGYVSINLKTARAHGYCMREINIVRGTEGGYYHLVGSNRTWGTLSGAIDYIKKAHGYLPPDKKPAKSTTTHQATAHKLSNYTIDKYQESLTKLYKEIAKLKSANQELWKQLGIKESEIKALKATCALTTTITPRRPGISEP
jgi:uncharacterized small protein (DUF1192 family)